MKKKILLSLLYLYILSNICSCCGILPWAKWCQPRDPGVAPPPSCYNTCKYKEVSSFMNCIPNWSNEECTSTSDCENAKSEYDNGCKQSRTKDFQGDITTIDGKKYWYNWNKEYNEGSVSLPYSYRTDGKPLNQQIEGAAKYNGCFCNEIPQVYICDQSKDADCDGVPDSQDKCPNEDEDLDGYADGDGCPDPDNDNDGYCDPWVSRENLEDQNGRYTYTKPDGSSATCINIDKCPNDDKKIDPGVCGCGNSETDTDNDGTPDCKDDCIYTTDRDNDGTLDCNDKCPDDPLKIEPGKCGCGVPEAPVGDICSGTPIETKPILKSGNLSIYYNSTVAKDANGNSNVRNANFISFSTNPDPTKYEDNNRKITITWTSGDQNIDKLVDIVWDVSNNNGGPDPSLTQDHGLSTVVIADVRSSANGVPISFTISAKVNNLSSFSYSNTFINYWTAKITQSDNDVCVQASIDYSSPVKTYDDCYAPDIENIEFVSDHEDGSGNNLLHKNSPRNTFIEDGTAYTEPEWTNQGVSNPISHTRNTKVKLKMTIKMHQDGIPFKIVGTSSYINFESTIQSSVNGTKIVEIESTEELPNYPFIINSLQINWTLYKDPNRTNIAWMQEITSNKIYITYGTPLVQNGMHYTNILTEKRLQLAINPISGEVDANTAIEALRDMTETELDELKTGNYIDWDMIWYMWDENGSTGGRGGECAQFAFLLENMCGQLGIPAMHNHILPSIDHIRINSAVNPIPQDQIFIFDDVDQEDIVYAQTMGYTIKDEILALYLLPGTASYGEGCVYYNNKMYAMLVDGVSGTGPKNIAAINILKYFENHNGSKVQRWTVRTTDGGSFECIKHETVDIPND